MIPARAQGQPLAALGLLVGGWVLVRLALWQAPFPLGEALAMPSAGARPAALAQRREAAPRSAALRVRPVGPPQFAPPASGGPLVTTAPSSIAFASLISDNPPAASAAAFLPLPAERPAATVGGPRTSPALALPPRSEGPGRTLASAARWSGDGWLLLRAGAAGGLATGHGNARYGGSQAGAVLRYRLASGGHRPALYARTSAALAGGADRELALGAAARPIAAVPVRAQVELRAVRIGGRLQWRPAAFAVSELRPISLPGQFRADAYAQAGYVAGDFATPFVGGDLRIDRPLAELGGARLRLGAGAWGGAQKDAAALDIGPGATLETRLGGVPARLALDYRLRVAGGAEPRSGVALTLTTGF